MIVPPPDVSIAAEVVNNHVQQQLNQLKDNVDTLSTSASTLAKNADTVARNVGSLVQRADKTDALQKGIQSQLGEILRMMTGAKVSNPALVGETHSRTPPTHTPPPRVEPHPTPTSPPRANSPPPHTEPPFDKVDEEAKAAEVAEAGAKAKGLE